MDIYNISGKFIYEIENVCRLFFPNEKFNYISHYVEAQLSNRYIIIGVHDDAAAIALSVTVKLDDTKLSLDDRISKNTNDVENQCECLLSGMLFKILCKITHLRPGWGIVTGVRPVKLYRSLVREKGKDYADEYFINKLLVLDEKLKLIKSTNEYEKRILNLSNKNSFSLYISIPFCPSRCSYCSFVSQSIEKCAKLIPEYLDLLIKEIEYTADLSKYLNLKLETIYIGGGTPTILNESQLFKLIETINVNFNMSDCREFTVEAGRPDTITALKLRAMKKGNISRISINPQTLNDEVLKLVGRKHSAEQSIKAFHLAREIGFHNINMDIIAGLPSESGESFYNTVSRVFDLSPEGITVHTLSLKRASYLNLKECSKIDNNSSALKSILSETYKKLSNNNYHPYYLYRQSKMVENMENIGWTKFGYDCLYNIYVMDETHTILACGAGAVTKLKEYKSNRIERIFNYKFAYEYISGFEEVLQRKRKVVDFYEQF